MKKYIFQRFLVMLPTLWLISVAGFWLCQVSPVDPLEKLECDIFPSEMDNECEQKLVQWELNLPIFYVSVASWAEPDTMYRIHRPAVRAVFTTLLHKYGNWEGVQEYKKALENTYALLKSAKNDSLYAHDSLYQAHYNPAENALKNLYTTSQTTEIEALQEVVNANLTQHTALSPILANFQQVKKSYQALPYQASVWKKYLPTLHVHGFENRYHHWLMAFLRGDLGYSYQNNQAISTLIGDYLGRSFSLALASVVLALVLGILLGVLLGKHDERTWAKNLVSFLFVLDVIPHFVIGTVLLYLFANPNVFNLFSARFEFSLAGFTLPLIAYSLGNIIHIAQFLQMQIREEYQADYVRTARAKGLSENQVFFRHLLKNAALPLAVIAGRMLPSLIGGIVVLESIFSVGGIGEKMLEAILNKDIPFVLAMLMLSAILTLVGYLLTDVLAFALNPKLRNADN